MQAPSTDPVIFLEDDLVLPTCEAFASQASWRYHLFKRTEKLLKRGLETQAVFQLQPVSHHCAWQSCRILDVKRAAFSHFLVDLSRLNPCVVSSVSSRCRSGLLLDWPVVISCPAFSILSAHKYALYCSFAVTDDRVQLWFLPCANWDKFQVQAFAKNS